MNISAHHKKPTVNLQVLSGIWGLLADNQLWLWTGAVHLCLLCCVMFFPADSSSLWEKAGTAAGAHSAPLKTHLCCVSALLPSLVSTGVCSSFSFCASSPLSLLIISQIISILRARDNFYWNWLSWTNCEMFFHGTLVLICVDVKILFSAECLLGCEASA